MWNTNESAAKSCPLNVILNGSSSMNPSRFSEKSPASLSLRMKSTTTEPQDRFETLNREGLIERYAEIASVNDWMKFSLSASTSAQSPARTMVQLIGTYEPGGKGVVSRFESEGVVTGTGTATTVLLGGTLGDKVKAVEGNISLDVDGIVLDAASITSCDIVSGTLWSTVEVTIVAPVNAGVS